MDFLQSNLIYFIPALGIIGLIVMAIKSAWVSKQDAGDAKMTELAGYIADGAMAFLKAEWKVLSIFVVFAAALLAYSGNDGYSIFNLNDIFIWMQYNYLYIIVVPFKFIIASLSGLPIRSGLPELDNIIG